VLKQNEAKELGAWWEVKNSVKLEGEVESDQMLRGGHSGERRLSGP